MARCGRNWMRTTVISSYSRGEMEFKSNAGESRYAADLISVPPQVFKDNLFS